MKDYTLGSLFAGIGGFDLGFHRAGFKVRWQVEIDDRCRGVLRRHFPETEIHRNVKEVGSEQLEPTDVICGGFPCQDVSVAGKRAGLAGERSGLWFEFARIADELGPRGIVGENVPGLLSTCGCVTCGAVRRILRIHGYLRRKRKIRKRCPICIAGERMLESHKGLDFARILSGLVERGYGVAWRILDSQYFGLAQRRRRVFFVGCTTPRGGPVGDKELSNDERISGLAAEILFERESMPWDTEALRAARKVAPTLFASGLGTGRPASSGSESDFVIPMEDVSTPILSHHRRDDLDSETFVASPLTAQPPSRRNGGSSPTADTFIVEQNSGATTPEMPSLRSRQQNYGVVALQQNLRDEVRQVNGDGSIAGALSAQAGMKQQTYIAGTLLSPSTEGSRQDKIPIVLASGQHNAEILQDQAPTLSLLHEQPIIGFIPGNSADSRSIGAEEDVSPTVKGEGGGAKAHVATVSAVRRMVPVECERLQGFPDDWTADQSDSTRYRQLGNAVSERPAFWIADRMIRVFSQEDARDEANEHNEG